MVSQPWIVMLNRLGKHMQLVPRGQLFRNGHGIALRAAAVGGEIARDHGDTQAL